MIWLRKLFDSNQNDVSIFIEPSPAAVTNYTPFISRLFPPAEGRIIPVKQTSHSFDFVTYKVTIDGIAYKLSQVFKQAMLDFEDMQTDNSFVPRKNIFLCDRDTFYPGYFCLAGAFAYKTLNVPLRRDCTTHFLVFYKDPLLNVTLNVDSPHYGFIPYMFIQDYYRVISEICWDDNLDEWKMHMASLIGILEAEGY